MRKNVPLAIVGIGCRFPPQANSPDEFWKLLCAGEDAVTEITPERWCVEKYYDPTPGRRGKSISKWAGLVRNLDQFDPGFFGISPREAMAVDPQQRLLLETAWEALEDAGEVVAPGSAVPLGVFVGISTTDYSQLQTNSRHFDSIDLYTTTGSAVSIAANRVSYALNLTGPSVALDTACSSALTAFHLACHSVWNGDCPMALVGGVNLIAGVHVFISFSRMGMLSPDGRCKAFDATANGFVRGEGCGMILLKPLHSALAEGNPIYAVVRGTAINQDGRTNGITVPSQSAQEALIRKVCIEAGVDPRAVRYVEAHGTGTPVGDPIEARALSAALCAGRDQDSPLLIGSVKTNIGHLEAAAGIAGLIKLALVLKHGMIPPNLHFKEPNPQIDFAALKLQVPVALTACNTGRAPMFGGVNSFGFGGANAHVILEAPPRAKARRAVAQPAPRDRALLLPLSARSGEALRAMAASYQEYLSSHSATQSEDLEAICRTSGRHRVHHSHRLGVVGQSREDMIGNLGAFLAGEARPGLASGEATPALKRGVVFVFSGQGPQWWAMGRELLAEEPVFRQTMTECDRLLREFANWSLLEEFNRAEVDSRLTAADIVQPALFSLQVALAALWRSWGVQPAAIVGHSIGEAPACYAAGLLSLREALRVAYHRGRCMSLVPPGGRMLAIGIARAEAEKLVAGVADRVTLAAINSPRSLTLSGDADVLEEIARTLDERGIFNRFLKVHHSFHSMSMEPIREELLQSWGVIERQPAQLPLFSTVTGAAAGTDDYDAAYWWRNVRQTVRFAPTIEALIAQGFRTFVEISPHPVLAGSILECLTEHRVAGAVVPSLRRMEPEHVTMLGSLAQLYAMGGPVDWAALFPGAGPAVRLPSYPWQRTRCWHEVEDSHHQRLKPPLNPLLNYDLRSANPTWETRLDFETLPYLRDHRVQNHAVFPAAGYVEMVMGAARQRGEPMPLVIEDLDLRKALIIPETGEAPTLTLSHSADDARFTIWSRAAEDGQSWALHSTGRMLSRTDLVPPALPELEELRKNCGHEVSVTALYEMFQQVGLHYGPAFRVIAAAWQGEGEALGRIRLPENLAGENRHYEIHPALLDGCLQLVLAALPTELGAVRLFLPVRIDRLEFFAQPGAAAWCHVRIVRCSRQSLTGDLTLLDEGGRVCLQLRGLHCQAVGRAVTGAGEQHDPLLFESRWKLQPLPLPAASQPPRDDSHAIARLVNRGRRQCYRWHEDHRLERERLRRAQPELDALCRSYILAALRQLGWEPRLNQALKLDELLAQLTIRPEHQRLLGRYLEILEVDGVLGGIPGGWRVRRVTTPVEPITAWRKLLNRLPFYFPELLLLHRCGSGLAGVLRGQTDVLQLLFPDGSVSTAEHLYQDSFTFAAGNRLTAQIIADLARRRTDRVLRVLEIGGGTGGLTVHVLPKLPADRTEYLFTDISPMFLAKAEQKFFEYPFLKYRTLDIERSSEEQAFAPHSFDLVIASAVLHATRDLGETIAHVRRLLAPGGVLVLRELTRTSRMTDLVFGLTEGWWRFADTDLRTASPLLSAGAWTELLKSAGFATITAAASHDESEPLQDVVLVARGPEPVESDTSTSAPNREGAAAETWLLFEDASGTARQLATMFAHLGHQVISIRPGAPFGRTKAGAYHLRPDSTEDMEQLIAELGVTEQPPLAGVVHLWSLDAPATSKINLRNLRATEAEGCLCVMHLAQALAKQTFAQKPRLLLVTRGSQPVVPGDDTAFTQAPVWGLGRVLINELRSLGCRMIDLPADGLPDEGRILFHELRANGAEEEIALRATGRYVNRLVPTSLQAHARRSRAAGQAFRLANPRPGMLDRLALQATPRRRPGPGEVEIEIVAAALNFRDVMKVHGIYPSDNDDDLLLGDECAGVVTRVGRGVRGLRSGDSVVAIGSGCLASHVTVPAPLVVRKPARFSFEEAVTIPIVFLTAAYALRHLGRLQRGERVLIHAATGGVGLAAIQIAQRLGAEVFATAGSPEKRELLRALGVQHVMDSRSLAFADEVRELTAGRGVDVVLNSLAGEAITKGIESLAPHGRFLELGKRDIYQNSRIGLRALRHNLAFFAVDLAQIIQEKPDRIASLFAELMPLFNRGTLHPLPHRVFPMSQTVSAFRFMAQARHSGKIVVAVDRANITPVAPPEERPLRFVAEATYLVSGGLGGFGLAVADWLVTNGARHLVLVGRRGAADVNARRAVERLRQTGAEVVVGKVDITRPAPLRRLFQRLRRSLPPLRGIIHAAAVMDDGAVSLMDRERFRRALAPKTIGTWNLHQQSLADRLDFFVMFSSVSALAGRAGQANYVAANSFLDALAHHRRAHGLPALTVNWGAIADVGYVAQNDKVKEYLSRDGFLAIPAAAALKVLGRLLRSDAVQIGVMHCDWTKVAQALARQSPRFSGLAGDLPERAAETPAHSLDQLLAMPAAEREVLVTARLRELIAKVLRTPAAKLDPGRPLAELGLDSLMGVELITSIESQFRVGVPPGKFTATMSTAKLAAVLLDTLSAVASNPAQVFSK